MWHLQLLLWPLGDLAEKQAATIIVTHKHSQYLYVSAETLSSGDLY